MDIKTELTKIDTILNNFIIDQRLCEDDLQQIGEARSIINTLFELRIVGSSLPKEEQIFLTCDDDDGEVFAAFTDANRCEKEVEECGCGSKTVTLYRGKR